MIYQRFGRTGLRMPLLSAGFMRCMQSWRDGPDQEIDQRSQDILAAVVHRALDLGITHLETARGYGTSERQLGRVLTGLQRHDFIIQTKVGPEDDPERFSANVLDSLARLRLDRLDLLTIHGINDFRSLWQVCRPGGCLAAARRLQRQGLVDWVGFSGHGSTEVILAAVGHRQDEGFDYVNLHWYTIFQCHTPVLKEAQAGDMGVFIISPTDKGGMLQKPPDRLRRLSSPLSPMQFNDLFCLTRPEIHTISVGASVPGDFSEHVAALDTLERPDLVLEIYHRWQQAMQDATGGAEPWYPWSVFRPWEQTPGYINIPMVLWLDNLARGWDLLEYARQRYAKLGRDMPWVRGNSAADSRRYDLSAVAAGANMETRELESRLQAAHRLLSGTGSGGS
ncbi:MAG TPA: aldo/keto reductase [Desulfobulbus sp.]|nr:aldo/keto reductase [Desulfobulbus sp.]